LKKVLYYLQVCFIVKEYIIRSGFRVQEFKVRSNLIVRKMALNNESAKDLPTNSGLFSDPIPLNGEP